MTARKKKLDSNKEATAAEPAAEWVDIGKLKPWAGNPRDNRAAIDAVVKSIKRFGFGAPIVARREDGGIIAGHTRFAAAQKLKLDRVPVRWMDLSAHDAHLLALADNKLGEIAEWEDEKLVELLSRYSREDAELAGFDSDELDKLADTLDEGDDDAPPDSFGVMVECATEREQADLVVRFKREGLTARAVS